MTTPQTAPTTKTLETPPRTWKPPTAGILMIIAGITATVAEIIYYTAGDLGIFAGVPWVESSANLKGALFATGIIAIVGGIFTLRRLILWLAIVGVVCSMFLTIWPVLAIGIISILLIATSRREFKRTKFG
jgi:hypothetical protein